jgi:hypothetical protein
MHQITLILAQNAHSALPPEIGTSSAVPNCRIQGGGLDPTIADPQPRYTWGRHCSTAGQRVRGGWMLHAAHRVPSGCLPGPPADRRMEVVSNDAKLVQPFCPTQKWCKTT